MAQHGGQGAASGVGLPLCLLSAKSSYVKHVPDTSSVSLSGEVSHDGKTTS